MTSYTARDEMGETIDLAATKISEAREEVEEWVRDGSWGTEEKTVWVDATISKHLDDEDTDGEDVETVTVAIDPEEPRCPEGEHDWQEMEGIIRKVRGHGGGIIFEEVCMHCGTVKTTDTWAQKSSTGDQGLTGISYEEYKYEGKVSNYNAKELAQEVKNAKTLDELLEALNEYTDYSNSHGVDEEKFVNYYKLPKFGGEDLGDDGEVFSWDENNVLIMGVSRWELEPR